MRTNIILLHFTDYYLFNIYECPEGDDITQSEYLFSEWYFDLNGDNEENPVSSSQSMIRYLEELLCCSRFKNSTVHVTVVNTNGIDLCNIPSKPGYYSTSMISLAEYSQLGLQKQTDITQLLIRSDFTNQNDKPNRLQLCIRSGSKKCSLFRNNDLILCDNVIEIRGKNRSFMSLCFYETLKMIGRIDLDASLDYFIHLHSTERNNKQLVTMKLYNSQLFLVATLTYEEGASLLTCDALPVFPTSHSYQSDSSSITLLDPICSIPAERTEITIQRVQEDTYRSLKINNQGEIQEVHSINLRTMIGTIRKRMSIRNRPYLLCVDLPQHDRLLTLRSKIIPSLRFVGKVTNWKNGCATGRLFMNSTLLYKGSWKQWKMEGEGTKYYMNGGVEFEGLFAKNVPHGKCRQYSFGDREASLLMYEGDFVNGLKDGEGELLNTRGDVVYSGKWKKDQINEEGTLTLQDVQGDCEFYVGDAFRQIARMENEKSVPSSNLMGKQIRCKKLISGMIVEMEYVREYVLGDKYKEEVVTSSPIPESEVNSLPAFPAPESVEIRSGRNSLDPGDCPPVAESSSTSISMVTKCPSTFGVVSNSYQCLRTNRKHVHYK